MRSIGYRRLLPALMLVAHLAIIVVMAHQRQGRVTAQEARLQTVVFQENTGVPFEPIRSPQFTAAQRVDLVLNFPAFLAAIPIALVWHHESDLFLFYVATVFVPLVWFAVGRWVDMRVGYLVRVDSTSTVKRVATGIAFVLAPVCFLLGFIMVTPLNHHRNLDAYWMGATMMLWSGVAFAMALVRGRTQPLPGTLVVP